MATTDKIELQREFNRKGMTIPMEMYRSLTGMIIETIVKKPEKAISLAELIEQVNLNNPLKEVLPWHILQVKIDLHQRGIIKISLDRDRMQIVEIHPRTKKRLKVLMKAPSRSHN